MSCRGTLAGARRSGTVQRVQPASGAQFSHSRSIGRASRNRGWSKVMAHCLIHRRASDSLRNQAGFRNASSLSSPNQPLTIHMLYTLCLLINLLRRGRSVLNFLMKLSEWLKRTHSCQKNIKIQYDAWVGPIDTYIIFCYRVNSNYLTVNMLLLLERPKVQTFLIAWTPGLINAVLKGICQESHYMFLHQI